jgi:ABC-type branched-subunit amino acid transport system substrate-binding protein
MAAGGGVLAVSLMPATVTYAADQSIAVDRQAYVPDAGPDAYGADALAGGGCGASQCPAPDPNAVHVASNPQQMTYHSLFHVALDALGGQSVSAVSVSLKVITPDTTAQDNVNNTAAILDAYPLATEFTASFTGCSASVGCMAPAVDTNGPKVVGKITTDSAGKVLGFTFDVGPMLPYWTAKGTNTGFAVVPNAAATTTPWTIAFDRTLSEATATVTSTAPLGQGTTATSRPVFGTSGGGTSLGGSGSIAPSTPAPTSAAAPSSSPSPTRAPAVVGSAPASGSGGGGIPVWLLVLGVSLAAAAALLAQPVSEALSASGGLRLGLRRELRIHPRMFAVAATLLAWSTAFGIYAGATGAGSIGGQQASAGSNANGSSLPAYAPQAFTPGPSASSPPGSTGPSTSGGGQRSGGAVAGAGAFAGAKVPVAPEAHLYTGADNVTGITDTTIQMCAHAALTFGPAFNIGPQDLNVFWQMVNDSAADPYPHTAGQSGIYNRKIVQPGGADGISVQDDGYQPSKAVQAAQACQDQSGGDFFLLSGIGFDQIPNVRVWAEQHHMLYIHHIATQQGTAGLQYSFTMLPTLELIGKQFAQYYLTHLNGQKIGIIERNSSNWSPGTKAFKAALQAAGVNVGPDDTVSNNQGDYSKEIVDMQTAGVQTVFIWENALAADNIIQQSSNQSYNPKWLLFPFNLTLQTLNQSNVDTSQMQGMVPWPAYTCASQRPANYFQGNAPYQQEVQQFEAAYARWDSAANLCGFGGDLLFGTWEAWKQVADLLVQCGPSCDRNRIAGLMLSGYRAQVGANCRVDFSSDRHHGGNGEDLYATAKLNGNAYWRNTGFCEETIR